MMKHKNDGGVTYCEQAILGSGGAAGEDAGVAAAAAGRTIEQTMDEGTDLVDEDVMVGLVLEVAPVEPVLLLARAGASPATESRSILGVEAFIWDG
jgi:hypothetical protein